MTHRRLTSTRLWATHGDGIQLQYQSNKFTRGHGDVFDYQLKFTQFDVALRACDLKNSQCLDTFSHLNGGACGKYQIEVLSIHMKDIIWIKDIVYTHRQRTVNTTIGFPILIHLTKKSLPFQDGFCRCKFQQHETGTEPEIEIIRQSAKHKCNLYVYSFSIHKNSICGMCMERVAKNGKRQYKSVRIWEMTNKLTILSI